MSDIDPVLRAVANTADGLFAVDEDYRIIFWSEEAERLLGYTPDEVMGRVCYEVMQGRDSDGNLYCHRDCDPVVCTLAGRKAPGYDLLTQTRDGKKKWVNVSIIGLPALGGLPGEGEPSPSTACQGPKVTLHLFRDIDSQKAAEQLADKVVSAVTNFSFARALMAGVPEGNGSPRGALTHREQEVLRLMAMGVGTTGIALRIGVSQVTVRNHVQRILTKLGVHTRAEAVSYAFRNQMV